MTEDQQGVATRAVRDAAGLAGAVPGAVLAAGLGLTALVRRDKALHPGGVVGDGTLTLHGAETGVAFLDRAATHPATVRFSWATGTGPQGRDIHGLALRLVGTRPSDWLFASTGAGSTDRFMLTTRRPGVFGTLTTLLPVDSPAGPLVLRAEPAGAATAADPPTRHELSAAFGTGPWQAIGEISVPGWGDDVKIRFDAVRNPVPGCRQYPFVSLMREPAYAASRFLGHR